MECSRGFPRWRRHHLDDQASWTLPQRLPCFRSGARAVFEQQLRGEVELRLDQIAAAVRGRMF